MNEIEVIAEVLARMYFKRLELNYNDLTEPEQNMFYNQARTLRDALSSELGVV